MIIRIVDNIVLPRVFRAEQAPGPGKHGSRRLCPLFYPLPTDININSWSPEFKAWAPMVVVVSIAHVEAITPLDACGSTGAFTADFFTNAIRAGWDCQQCRGTQNHGSSSHERN